jgi:hypothetical protein
MAIQQKLVITVPSGSTYVPVDKWAEAVLPEAELPLFKAAQERQTAFVASKATSVDLVAGFNTFADQSAADASQGGDPDFLIYWYRYLVDTGYTAEKTSETI